MLSLREPYPPDSGCPLVVYNDIVRLQQRGHTLYLLAITNNVNADPVPMQRICPTQYFYVPNPARWRRVLGNIGKRMPFNMARYFDRRLLKAACEVIPSREIDVVLAQQTAMGTYGPPLREAFGVPYVVRGHNVDTQILDRFVAEQRNPVLRTLGKWQRGKCQAHERYVCAEADGFSAITKSDAAELRRLFPGLEPAVVGAGTDLDYFRPSDKPRDPLLITHVGSLTEFTKLQPILWFCRQVLPLIRAKQPAARLELAGWSPTDAFGSMEGVTALGLVPDARVHLWNGRVFIAIQFVGSGVRLKILNAMATGNAIVCTPVACEGIPLVDGEHALIREKPRDLAEAVLSLLADGELASRLGRNARRMAEEHYSWDGIITDLERLLVQAIERRRAKQDARN